MAHLTIKFAEYQIYFYIRPTYPENFIKIQQAWSKLQSQKHLEVKLKIYALSLLSSQERQWWKNWFKKKWEVFYSNNLIIFGRVQVLIWKMSLNKKNFLGAINFNTGIQKHWNQIKWIHSKCVKVCIFWIWPLIALEAVAEAILASSQWNF